MCWIFGFFFEIFLSRNMVKRPGLGKRNRVTQPQSEAADQPEQPDELPDTQASDPGDTATQPEDTEELEEATQDMSGSLGEPRVCITPPPGISLSTTSCWHRRTSKGRIWIRRRCLMTGRSSWTTGRSSWTACNSR